MEEGRKYRIVGTDGTLFGYRSNQTEAVSYARHMAQRHGNVTVEHNAWTVVWGSQDLMSEGARA